jgi:HAD superfamily hydrolase (TIGR01450 family)
VTLAGRYDLVVFDLDGVVYVGAQAVPGAPEAIQALVAAGIPVAYATNNASRRATEVASLLVRLGVPARPEEVVTSARATAELLAGQLPPGAPVLPVGAPALREELAAVGLTPVARAEDRPVAVVQGYGPDVGWALLAEACVAVRAGARWVATNADATMPSPRGPVPGNGALVAALATALGRQPDTVVGKPAPGLLEAAARLRGAHRVLVVGDRLDTDIEGAARAGMDSLLVLTGVTTPADLLTAPAHRRPTHVAADLGALSQPDDAVRVPEWDGAVVHRGWRVTVDDRHLVLASDIEDHDSVEAHDPVAALRALAVAAWQCPQWTAIRADAAGESALSALGLRPYARPMAEAPGPA